MASTMPTIRIPPPLLASGLMRQGGFAVYEGLPDPATFARIHNEAAERYPHASAQECRDDDLEELRGGRPGRSLLTAEAGPAQDALYASPGLAGLLSSICGVPVLPSGGRGSYSYYARPGDYLGLHRDVETCDLAMITTLHDNSAPSDQAGALVLYPGRIHERLSAIRQRPDAGAHVVKLAPGHTVLLFGGVVPHRVLPVRENQLRMISVLCFRAVLAE